MQYATLYVAQVTTLDEVVVRRVAVDAGVTVKKRGLFRPAVESFTVRWPGLEVKLTFMVPAEVAEHLRGFVGFCLSRGAEPGSSLMGRVTSTKLVVGMAATEDDESGRMEQLVWNLARELDALVFLAPGAVFDAGGKRCLPAEATTVKAIDDEEDADCEPPTRERIARRALALCGVTYRALLEIDRPEGAAQRLDRLRTWLTDAHVWEELEPQEQALVSAPMGTFEQQAAVNGSWRSEGLAVLVWYLGLRELPAHDEQADPGALWDACDFLGALPPRILQDATTRTSAERERMASQLLGLHWRLRDFGLRPGAMDFRRFADNCWFGKMNVEGVAFAGDDLALHGKPIAEAPRELVTMASSIAMERHQAINWLDGFHPVYSEVDTST